MISNSFLKITLGFKEFIYSKYWIIPFSGLLFFGLWFTNSFQNLKFESAAIVLGGFFGFQYFIQKQKLEEMNFFRKVFIEFNAKYEELSLDLNKILSSNSFVGDQSGVLIKYFNLCAEEFLLYKKGYIPLEIWNSWLNGMEQYWNIPDVQKLWQQELKTGSYYGFNPKIEFQLRDKLINFHLKKAA